LKRKARDLLGLSNVCVLAQRLKALGLKTYRADQADHAVTIQELFAFDLDIKNNESILISMKSRIAQIL
jgi:hypothetical protein